MYIPDDLMKNIHRVFSILWLKAGISAPSVCVGISNCCLGSQEAVRYISIGPLNAILTRLPPRASFKTPLTWIKESLSLNVREKASKEEIEAARKEQAEKGQLSVFESLPPAEGEEEVTPGAGVVKPKKVHTEVCCLCCHFIRRVLCVFWCSTNTPLPISKYPTAS